MDKTKEFQFELDDLKKILNCIDDGVFITDGKGNVIFGNKEALDDIPLEKIVGRNMKDLIEEGIYEDSAALKVIKANKAVTMIQHEGVDILTTAIPYYKNNEIYMVVCCERAIDEIDVLKKKLKDSMEKNEIYKRELEDLRTIVPQTSNIIAESDSMQNVLKLALIAAKSSATILLTGETGVGKEVVAKYIYQNGFANNEPFISVNCAAIPESLFESEMYGYEAGSFTGANSKAKKGFFELSNNGILFLDEIGDIHTAFQSKLLRAIQENEIYRVGGTEPIPINPQIIAATNKDLSEEVKNGDFRADLYYRINTLPIEIPPLRDRTDDIIPLAEMFCEKYNKKYETHKVLSNGALEFLSSYDWPGNVRELDNVIERAVLTSTTTTIDNSVLSEFLSPEYVSESGSIDVDSNATLKEIIEDYEKKVLVEYAKKLKSSAKIEKTLDVSRATINRKIKKYELREYIK